MMNLRGLSEKSGKAEFLREMIDLATERLMEIDAGGPTGAGVGEKSTARLA